ncbi:MAG: hypothetical protein PVF51_08420 [Nitrospirota bacterium]|jgi:hypothetical protein
MQNKRLLSELKDYKKTINPVTRGTVTWKEGLLFEARTVTLSHGNVFGLPLPAQ